MVQFMIMVMESSAECHKKLGFPSLRHPWVKYPKKCVTPVHNFLGILEPPKYSHQEILHAIHAAVLSLQWREKKAQEVPILWCQ